MSRVLALSCPGAVLLLAAIDRPPPARPAEPRWRRSRALARPPRPCSVAASCWAGASSAAGSSSRLARPPAHRPRPRLASRRRGERRRWRGSAAPSSAAPTVAGCRRSRPGPRLAWLPERGLLARPAAGAALVRLARADRAARSLLLPAAVPAAHRLAGRRPGVAGAQGAGAQPGARRLRPGASRRGLAGSSRWHWATALEGERRERHRSSPDAAWLARAGRRRSLDCQRLPGHRRSRSSCSR